MNRHRTFEERLYIVRQILSGKALRPLSREYHLSREVVRQWILLYQTYGADSLRCTQSTDYSSEEKYAIVKEFLEKGLPLQKICLRYRINNSTLRGWIAKVEKGQSLETRQRGRSPQDSMARLRKKELQTELEKLQTENLRLRAENALLKKSEGLSRGTKSPSTSQWAKAIDELRSEYPLDLILELRQMARSVFYYHLKRQQETDKYAAERSEIRDIFNEHKGRYGYRRVTQEMRNRGFTINHKTVRRLMTEMGLKSTIRKVRYRSYRGDVGTVAPNLLARDFVATASNRKWATDITQINIGSVKLYLSPILDMFNGEIIAHNISYCPNLDQVYDMLDKAFGKFDNRDGELLWNLEVRASICSEV